MDLILALLDQYRLLAMFVGSFVFGDSVIITGAYLAGQLDWAVLPIFTVAFLGTAASDVAWFIVGVYAARHGSKLTMFEKQRAHVVRLMDKLTGKRIDLALIYIKFLYGGRIAMILYAAARGMTFRTFMIYNSLGILAWFLIFFPLGYFAGKGIARAMPLVGTLEAAIVVLVVSTILIRLFYLWLTRTVENE